MRRSIERLLTLHEGGTLTHRNLVRSLALAPMGHSLARLSTPAQAPDPGHLSEPCNLLRARR